MKNLTKFAAVIIKSSASVVNSVKPIVGALTVRRRANQSGQRNEFLYAQTLARDCVANYRAQRKSKEEVARRIKDKTYKIKKADVKSRLFTFSSVCQFCSLYFASISLTTSLTTSKPFSRVFILRLSRVSFVV